MPDFNYGEFGRENEMLPPSDFSSVMSTGIEALKGRGQSRTL
jgi:hypothetical protein